MTKTFAEMTTTERTECQGMWCNYRTPMGDHLAIYEAGTTLFEPGYGRFRVSLENITPRFDLPRAWTVDGAPLHGQWEHTQVPGLGESTRRWIGDWENE